MNIEISNQTLRNGAALVFVGMTAIAVASPLEVPHAAQSGQPMAASQFNGNLQAIQAYSTALEDRLAALELQVAGEPQGSDVCGVTQPLNGNAGGHSALKTLCQAACGGDAGAHLCTDADLRALYVRGVPQTQKGRYSAPWAALQIFTAAEGLFPIGDCAGWTSADTGIWSWQVNSDGRLGGYSRCDDSAAFLCCSSQR